MSVVAKKPSSAVWRKTVTKCVCQKRTFEELIEIAADLGYTTAQELHDAGYSSNNCGMCFPYVEKALRTGETAFAPGDVY